MKVEKINGEVQSFNPNKIYNRIKKQSVGLKVDVDQIFKLVIPELSSEKTLSTRIDEIIAFKIAEMIQYHPDYSTLASRILITRQAKLLGVEPKQIDLDYDFYGTVAFFKKYSLRNEKQVPIELPSMMYERVANFFGIDEEEKQLIKEELFNRTLSLATPILANGGSEDRGSFISCNITTLESDSKEGIMETLKNVAFASGQGAGIGLCIDSLRSEKSLVNSFKGNASGIIRFADMAQSIARFFKQGPRSGSFALYLSLWHKDIIPFLELKLPIGDEKKRTRDLFFGVIVNDNFMNALINDEPYYLFCPEDIRKAGLKPFQDIWGVEFEEEYNKAVALGLGEKIDPKTIWNAIIISQTESGTPYVFYKDEANRKNMQVNIGTIKSSNLCIEFLGVSAPGYTSQCDLGLIPVAYHDSLETIDKSTTIAVRALNRVIDKNQWSDIPSEKAGNHQRAIGIGIGGLADFFAKKKLAFTSPEAKKWNIDIMETIYKAAVRESCRMAQKENRVYPAWEGSPYSKGKTYVDGWYPEWLKEGEPIPMLNSILICLMPSASTSALLSINECFEPFSSNLQVRNEGAGEFIVINKWLVRDLEKLKLWDENMVRALVSNGGSVQNIDIIPDDIKERYLTVWEIPQKEAINMCVDRAPYIDQSQSMNLYFADGSYGKISGALKYAWEKGLKTGCYYIRTQKKTETPKHLSEIIKEKPKDSQFECFGCSS